MAATGEVAGVSEFGGAFVVDLWNEEPLNWKVEFWQDGVKKGDFTKLSYKSGSREAVLNPAVLCHFYDKVSKALDKQTTLTSVFNLWYYKPASETPSAEKNWQVRAIHTNPSSGAQHTYVRSVLTKDIAADLQSTDCAEY